MSMNAPVLILNANYEPLGTCTTKRAMGILMNGKAEIIISKGSPIRTPSTQFPRPSIVRLSHMIHRPRLQISLSKEELFRRDNYTCQYCGRKSRILTIDHVFPRRRGGMSTWENLTTACPECNRFKGDRTPEEAGMPLLRQPRRPSSSAEYVFAKQLKKNGDWIDYLSGW